MKIEKLLSIVVFLLLLLSFSFTKKRSTVNVTIHISNLQATSSAIRIAVYRATDKFPKEDKFYKAFVHNVTATSSTSYTITGLDEGDYAFALYQDINNNGKLNTNLFGYPKEPFCFSNNIKPIISAPTFAECKVKISASNNSVSVKMIR